MILLQQHLSSRIKKAKSLIFLMHRPGFYRGVLFVQIIGHVFYLVLLVQLLIVCKIYLNFAGIYLYRLEKKICRPPEEVTCHG